MWEMSEAESSSPCLRGSKRGSLPSHAQRDVLGSLGVLDQNLKRQAASALVHGGQYALGHGFFEREQEAA